MKWPKSYGTHLPKLAQGSYCVHYLGCPTLIENVSQNFIFKGVRNGGKYWLKTPAYDSLCGLYLEVDEEYYMIGM